LKIKKYFSIFLLILAYISFFTYSSPFANANTVNHLLITEILYDAPTSDNTEEWVELFNPTANPINLQGWTISDNAGTFSFPSLTIPSSSYLILARSSTAFNTLYGFTPNISTFSLSLSNSGDLLSLKDNFQTEIDYVAWETSSTGWSVGAIDTTIQRIKDSNLMPVDTDIGADWEPSGTLGSPASGYEFVNSNPNTENIEVYFNDPIAGLPWMDKPIEQANNLSSGLVTLIDSANTTIDAALYHLDWFDIVTALNNAKNRGVIVRIAAHNDSITSGDFESLMAIGVSVVGVTTPYIMHNKFFIVDSGIVWTGSYNPTITGTLDNANDGVKITSTNVAQIYQAEFDQLFTNTYASHKIDNNEELTMVKGEVFEVYFAPKDSGKLRLLELINSANQSIHLSLFYMTDNDIYNSLMSAYNRGVIIKAVFDYRGWRDSYSEADLLINLGLGVVDANPGVYHHKFGVFDSSIVWTGSTNWSGSGFGSNDENSIVIHNINVAKQYVARTEAYFTDANNYDNSQIQAPRIITKHYTNSPGSNFVSWRVHLNGNTPKENFIQKYLIWRWNDTRNNYDFLQAVDFATGYYSDSNVEVGKTYYYCVSALINNQMTTCSAEFAQIGAGGYQPTVHPPRNSLQNFGLDVTAPSVSILNPSSGSSVSGFTDLFITGSDSSYLSDWQILIDGSIVSESSLFNIDTTTLIDGIHTITGRIKDIFGNWGVQTLFFSVNNSNYVPIANPTYDNLKIMSYNIEASGMNPSWKNVVEEENPDVAILIETGNWDDFGNRTMNQAIIDLNSYFVNELPFIGATTQGMGSQYSGIAIFSRFPILLTKQLALVQLDDGSFYDVSHDFLHAKLEVGTGTINIIGAHLKATAGASNEFKRERAQEGIINYMDTLGNNPILYMGDLNSFSPEDTGSLAPNGTLGYGSVSMLLNWVNYTQFSPTMQNYVDVFRSLNPNDPGYSYPSAPYASRIDFIFASDYFSDKLLSSTVGDTLSANSGSDHFSVDVNLNLTDLGPMDIIAPAQVQNVTAQIINNTSVNLQWNANTENDLFAYRIYRNNTFIAQTTQILFVDDTVYANTFYSYTISAIDQNFNEGLVSNTISIFVPSPTSMMTKIIFSEIYYDTIGTDNVEEYIELYNTQSTTVDLSGWQIMDNVNTYTIPQGTFIQGNSYLVIARNSVGFNTLFGHNPDVSGLTLSLGNTGDKLTLFNATGSEIDFVAWENYITGWSITTPTGQVLRRTSVLEDNDIVSDWLVAVPNPH
jgi:phosphatidylserine/phosphatidylglycerophosphate/cardiolipin synthase-like enzyme/exonuclease III